MKLVRTGAGSLSRKLTAILVTTAMLLSGLSFAADNSIYIDQSGDNSTVIMTQDGYGNIIRGVQVQGGGTSNTTPAKIYGDNNQVTVNQVGNSNTLNLGITTTTGNGMGDPTVIYQVTGNNAVATINSNSDGQGTSESNYIRVRQTGNGALANINVLGSGDSVDMLTSGGNNNSVTATVNGNNNTTSVSMTQGGSNSATINQNTSQATANVTTTGVSNSVNISQSGTAGTNGFSATVAADGGNNTVGITQSGAGDHSAVVAVTNTGTTTNTISITQGGSAGNNIANIASAGTGNTITINQNNNSSH